MRQRSFIVALGAVVLTALVAGCAGVGSRIDGSPSGEGSALPRDLSGSWQGSFGQLALGNSYDDIADCTLRIKEDATYSAACQRPPIGTNNLMRPATWSGRVVTKGDRVILQNGGGPWPSIVLRRSRSGALYGTTVDPLVGATVEMRFHHDPTPAASPGGN